MQLTLAPDPLFFQCMFHHLAMHPQPFISCFSACNNYIKSWDEDCDMNNRTSGIGISVFYI